MGAQKTRLTVVFSMRCRQAARYWWGPGRQDRTHWRAAGRRSCSRWCGGRAGRWCCSLQTDTPYSGCRRSWQCSVAPQLRRCWLPAGLWIQIKTRVSYNKLCTERQQTANIDFTMLHLGKNLSSSEYTKDICIWNLNSSTTSSTVFKHSAFTTVWLSNLQIHSIN